MSNPYRKSVRHLDEIDIYQIGNLYEVKSHAVFHALKKLLCAGKRGAKDYEQDLMEAIESIERELQIVGLATAKDEGFCGDDPRASSDFDEQRIDVIGQNGNEGEHYEKPWIQHDGGPCPLPEGTKLDILDRDGEVHVGVIVGDWATEERWWSWKGKNQVNPMFSRAHIVAYRLA